MKKSQYQELKEEHEKTQKMLSDLERKYLKRKPKPLSRFDFVVEKIIISIGIVIVFLLLLRLFGVI